MKYIIKKIVKNFIYILYHVFPPKFFNWFRVTGNRFYSMWKSNDFNSVDSVHIQYPMYLVGGKHIKLGFNIDIDQRLRLEAFTEFLGDTFNPSIVIGDNVSIQKDCHIGAINSVVIGSNVLLASKVYISDHSHGEISVEAIRLPPAQRKLYSKGPVVIEDNVWLGEGVVVLPNVTIGENCIIGANSIVTKSIPRNCVAAGNPARVIKILT